jgi:hypothetical protein
VTDKLSSTENILVYIIHNYVFLQWKPKKPYKEKLKILQLPEAKLQRERLPHARNVANLKKVTHEAPVL